METQKFFKIGIVEAPKWLHLSEKDKEYSEAWQTDEDQKRFAVKLENQILKEIDRFITQRNKER